MTMTNPASVKDLLDAAREWGPLPWTVSEDEDGYYSVSAKGDGIVSATHNHVALFPMQENADLAAYAVNHLPDYEAAIDALESVVAYFERMGLDAPVGLHLQAHHALNRLRGES